MNQFIWDVTLWILASPIYLVQWLARLIRRWRFWRFAYVPATNLQRLRLRDLTGGDVAMPLRVPSGWPLTAGLSRVPEPAAYGPVFCLRCYGETA